MMVNIIETDRKGTGWSWWYFMPSRVHMAEEVAFLQRRKRKVHGILQVRILDVSSLSLLQGFFPTQGLNAGLLHCRQILYQLNHKGSPGILGVGRLSLLQQIFRTQELNPDLLHCRWILYQLSYQGSPKEKIR